MAAMDHLSDDIIVERIFRVCQEYRNGAIDSSVCADGIRVIVSEIQQASSDGIGDEIDVKNLLASRYAENSNSLTNTARSLGCAASYVADVMHGRRSPGPAMLTALGVVKETKYRRWR